MPVAIRKRSWEEHVTHPSGLQYSFDDLDLVCCHGVDGEGFWVGSGALKQGRRTRCASMPEGCQMPSDDLGRTALAEAFAVDDVDSNNCEMLNQTLAEKHNVAKAARNWPHTLESAEQGEPFDTFHSNVKNQCLAVIETVSAEHQGVGKSERESTQTSTMCCGDQLVKTSLSQSLDNMVESSLPKESTACEDADTPLPIENNCSKLVTIPEIRLIEADDDDTLVKARKKTEADITENQVHNTLLDNKYHATEQHMKLPVLSKEVSEGLHGNQTSGLSESPCSEVADGYRENRSLGGRVSAMGELDDAIFSAVSSETPPSGSDVKGTHEAGDQKEDSVVKVRMRKVSHEHARLDSMVLLLMKLDQLDQEIENALSATSSMDSTPTLHRRHHLVHVFMLLVCSFYDLSTFCSRRSANMDFS
uniref:Rho GTPase-activating protein 7 n=1 Tax=Poecilia latipinna TaxID=48699 RepID=A0A3B3TL30_9TELE